MSAQGCGEAATLGKQHITAHNPNGVVYLYRQNLKTRIHNPFGVEYLLVPGPQGSDFVATLG